METRVEENVHASAHGVRRDREPAHRRCRCKLADSSQRRSATACDANREGVVDGIAQCRPLGPARLAGRARLQQLRRPHRLRGDAGASCIVRSTRASRCSIPRTPTATAAHSESFLGELLGDRRKDIVLATKFGMAMDDAGIKQGGSRRYIMSAVEASLARLRTDWIDLYQLHQPDPLTPIEETLRALDDLVRAGQGALHRLLQPRGLAGRRRRVDVASSRPRRVRLRAGRVQPARTASTSGSCCPRSLAFGDRLASRTSRSRAACSPASIERDAPLPEGARLTYTKALRRPLPHRAQLGARRSACGVCRERAATRWSSSRSRGSPRARRWRASSPARRSPSRSTPTSRPWHGASRQDELDEIDQDRRALIGC